MIKCLVKECNANVNSELSVSLKQVNSSVCVCVFVCDECSLIINISLYKAVIAKTIDFTHKVMTICIHSLQLQ